MARSYAQIQKQIEELQREAEKLREQEVSGVVSRIKVAIEHYGLTAAQLGFVSANQTGSLKSLKQVRGGARYADGQGNTWSGRGPRPSWLKEALAAGSSLERFAIGQTNSSSSSKRVTSAPKKKRVAKFSYKDDAGHAWSGFGPRPQWVKDAIAAGRTLEELQA